MTRRPNIPIALSIAGSDSGGGAGAQADLKTFAALGIHGTSAITCLTAQNPREVRAIQPASPALLHAQLEALFAELPPAAAKTGMLFSAPLIHVVVKCLRQHNRLPVIVDPVMAATSGSRLLQPAAMKLLQRELLPLATLITPNLVEAELLLGTRLRDEEDLRAAARALHARFGCAALVKGGHLRGAHDAVDIFFDGTTELMLSAPFVRGVSTHGTGCTYSAAITACLARAPRSESAALPQAVTRAKEFITQAIAQACRAGRHDVLNPHFASRPARR